MSAHTTIIIGGGVIGLSTAYHLARRRHGRITVLEKGVLGEGSSSRAAGITTGLLWSETGIRARKIGIRLFRELARELDGYSYHDERGCLNLFSPELWPAREKLLPLYDRLGAPYEILASPEIRGRWPELNPPDGFLGLHDPSGGYSEPEEYLKALARRLRALGVDIREHQKVTGLIVERERLVGVQTADEDLKADAVVSTVHAWTLPFLKPLGVRFPVKHFVHQRYLSAPFREPLAFPPLNADPYGGYLRTAFGNRILLGVETPDREEWKVTSTGFHMSELSAPSALCDEAVKRFRPFCPALAGATWESAHVSLISFSSDGEPILGPVAEVPGLFVGLAFHSGGFSYNTVAGMLLAEFVVQGKTALDVSAFSPNRFGRDLVSAHLATTVEQTQAVRRRH